MLIIDPKHQILTPLSRDVIYPHLERSGRVAYRSYGRITNDSAPRFIQSIIRSGHESVIEHFAISVDFVCDRGVSHELVRHRLCSFTQESTRYCNYDKIGIMFIRPFFWKETDDRYKCWLQVMEAAEKAYTTLIDSGATPEEARSVLPNSLATEIVVTANIREWRHILRLRTAASAHPQMRQLMIPLLVELKRKLPVLFDDIEVQA